MQNAMNAFSHEYIRKMDVHYLHNIILILKFLAVLKIVLMSTSDFHENAKREASRFYITLIYRRQYN